MIPDEARDAEPEREPTPGGAPNSHASSHSAGDVTRILSAIEEGDGQAAEQLLPLVYDELRRLAAAKMAQEQPGQTLEATALVHEAYLRLVDVEKAQHWNSRGHFYCAAAEAMRRILVEQARHKSAWAAGGHHRRIALSQIDLETQAPELDLLALSEALDKLARTDPRAARVVKLRFFAGLSRSQVAELLDVSVSTIDTDWTYARCWLQLELSGGGPPDNHAEPFSENPPKSS